MKITFAVTMQLRKFQASEIFDGRTLLHDKVLITDTTGTILDLIDAEEAGEEVEKWEGLLLPGLINAHCHLELSHLKDVIPPHTGLIEFLCSVVTKRGFDPAVVDHYLSVADTLRNALRNSPIGHRTAIVPHAPYSISPDTFARINQHTAGEVISMHNQEHPAEDDLYRTGQSEYLRLFRIFGIDRSPFPVTGTSALRSVLPYFANGQTLFLVHNTSTPEEDIIWAEATAKANGIKLVWCLSINANRYIENKVPPADTLHRLGCHLVLGTDSYSSNWQLSIAQEMKAIRDHFPSIPPEDILRWATANGASALRWEDQLGSFEKGKRPGVVLLSPDWESSRRLL